MNQREVELRRAEMEAANLESNLASEMARLQNGALEVQSRLEGVRSVAARLADPTPGQRLQAIALPGIDLEAQLEAALKARAEALNLRLQANQRLKQAVHAFSGELSRIDKTLQEEERALQEAEARAKAEATRRAAEKAKAAVPPQAQVAPAPAPKRTQSSEVARRAQARVLMQAAVDMSSDTNFFSGFSTNLSDGGIFIATVKQVPIGTEVDLAFTLPSGEKIQAQGVVRWIREVNDRTPDIFPGVGVQFKNLPEQVQASIHRFVASREPMFYPD